MQLTTSFTIPFTAVKKEKERKERKIPHTPLKEIKEKKRKNSLGDFAEKNFAENTHGRGKKV